jgi:hypothetical protein
MKYRNLARHLLCEIMTSWASDRGYREDDANDLAEGHSGKKKTLSPSEHRRVREAMQREVGKYRDRLVKDDVILDGCPLPWETDDFTNRRREADRVDGYDRDDTGLSPD